MIALVATDLDSNKDIELDIDEEEKPLVSATLIVIPPPCKPEPHVRFHQDFRLTYQP